MRITGLCASPRGKKSATLSLVKEGLKGAESKGAKTEIIDICKKEIKYCKGCGKCYEKGKCVLKDDFEEILETLIESDGIILGSPNYINSVSGQMKTFLDRFADSIHCQKFTGKYGFSVSTAGGSKSALVADYLNDTLQILGANTVGRVNIDIGQNPEGMPETENHAYKTGMMLADAIENRQTWPEQDIIHKEMRERMKFLVTLNKDNWHHEFDYWKKQGWL